MKIDKKLNLIVPVYGDDEKTIRCYVHSTPISRETFERYFLIIGQTFGADLLPGPRHRRRPARGPDAARADREEHRDLGRQPEGRRGRDGWRQERLSSRRSGG